MTKRLRTLLSAVCAVAIIAGGALILPGCDNASSDATSGAPSAEQQAAIDKANQETAAAHAKDTTKKKGR